MMVSIPSVLLVSLTPFSFTPTTLLLLAVLTVFLFIYITTDGVWFVPGFGVWSGLVWSAWFGFFAVLPVARCLHWFSLVCLLAAWVPGFLRAFGVTVEKERNGLRLFCARKVLPITWQRERAESQT